MNNDTYKSLFEDSHSVMLIVHPGTGEILDANKTACTYYGYGKSELTAMNISQINTLSGEQIHQEMQAAQSENRNHFFFNHRLADGDIREVDVYSGPIVINNERVLYSIIHDITDRKRIEKQIEIERQFSDSLISSLPGIMYVFNQLRHFIRWNENFERVSGYDFNQIKRLSPLDFIAAQDKERVRDAIADVFDKGSAVVEARLSTVHGQDIPYLFTGYRFNLTGMKYLVGIGIDISARVQIETEKENLIYKLQETLSQVKQLSGLLPIYASCKKIRDDKGYWNQIESYIKKHSDAEFTHGICPECAKRLYPEQFK